jgi:hypothetical protein
LQSQKSFNCVIIVLTTKEPFSIEKQKQIDKMLVRQSFQGDSGDDSSCNFYEATGGRATMSSYLSTLWRT